MGQQACWAARPMRCDILWQAASIATSALPTPHTGATTQRACTHKHAAQCLAGSLDVVVVKQRVVHSVPPVLPGGPRGGIHQAHAGRHLGERRLKVAHRVGRAALRRLPRRHVGLRGGRGCRFRSGGASGRGLKACSIGVWAHDVGQACSRGAICTPHWLKKWIRCSTTQRQCQLGVCRHRSEQAAPSRLPCHPGCRARAPRRTNQPSITRSLHLTHQLGLASDGHVGIRPSWLSPYSRASPRW